MSNAQRDPRRAAIPRHPAARRPTTNRKARGSRVANIKSQIKRVKTNEKRRLRNKSVKSSVRTAIRRFREAVEAGDQEQIIERQRYANRALDKAASKGVIHRNQAANKKSAMARRVNSLDISV
jgi:small subunit ribosomal protein S20